MQPTDASELTEKQKLILLAALVQGHRPNPDGYSANCGGVLMQVLQWTEADRDEGLRKAWNADKEHPVIEEWYECLRSMVQVAPAENALLEGNAGRRRTRPLYTSCYLTTRSEPIAEQLLKEWMQRDWSTCSDYRVMMCYVSRKANQRQLLLLACASCRRALSVTNQSEMRRAVEAPERFVEGKLARATLGRYLREAKQAAAEFAETETARLSQVLSDNGAFETEMESIPQDVVEIIERAAKREGSSFRSRLLKRRARELSEETCSAYRAVVSALSLAAQNDAPLVAGDVVSVIENNVKFYVNLASPAELAYLSEPALDVSAREAAKLRESKNQSDLVRCLFGNPFVQLMLDPQWLEANDNRVSQIARSIHDDQRWSEMPLLADALVEAGCNDREILDHCRRQNLHARGCWVVDLLLGKK